MRYNHKQTQDFFSSLSYVDPKQNNPEVEDVNFDDFLLGSLQLFRSKAKEIYKEEYKIKSFYHAGNDKNKRIYQA